MAGGLSTSFYILNLLQIEPFRASQSFGQRLAYWQQPNVRTADLMPPILEK
jgi:hypothetical protein